MKLIGLPLAEDLVLFLVLDGVLRVSVEVPLVTVIPIQPPTT